MKSGIRWIKRICILCILLFGISSALTVDAEETLPESPAEDFAYTITDDEVTITDYIGKEQTVVIPSYI